MVKAEPPDNYDEPRRELASPVISVRAEPVKVVPTKLAENECVAIHHVIVVPAERPGNVEDEFAVALNECGPSLIAGGLLGMIE
jgi:hypothetical protein